MKLSTSRLPSVVCCKWPEYWCSTKQPRLSVTFHNYIQSIQNNTIKTRFCKKNAIFIRGLAIVFHTLAVFQSFWYINSCFYLETISKLWSDPCNRSLTWCCGDAFWIHIVHSEAVGWWWHERRSEVYRSGIRFRSSGHNHGWCWRIAQPYHGRLAAAAGWIFSQIVSEW